MKTMKYIFALLLCPILLGLVSCSEETITKDGSENIEGLRLLMSVSGGNVVSPLTKSTEKDADEISDLNILIYNSDNGSLVKAFYYGQSSLNLSIDNNSDANAVAYDIALQDGSYKVRAIVNAGNLGNISLTDIDGKYYANQNEVSPKMIMFASADDVIVSGGRASVSLSLVRIYSMVSVVLDTEGLDEGISVVPTSIKLKNIPNRGYLLSGNKIDGGSISCVENGESILQDAFTTSDKKRYTISHPLFLYENMQGNGNNVGEHKNEQAYKTPPSFPYVTKDFEVVKTDRTCSYIELTANYLKNNSQDVSGAGTITYRFFIGDDAYNNFDVERNTQYRLTLTLTGKGGTDEGSWRVEKKFRNEIDVSDAFIGYPADSETYLLATGDIGQITNVEIVENETVSGDDLFYISQNNAQGDGRVYVKVRYNNTHDFKSRTCKVRYTVNNGTTKYAYVHQVPRLIDPIAIFKPATGPTATSKIEIVVKAYDKNKKSYEPLESTGGPWSATIKSGSWFEISNEGETADVEGEKVNGKGQVRFQYKPLSENSGTEARFGIILVKYHNERCEHEIYVRQGYQNTQLGQAEWSMYNCLGLDDRGNRKMTEYPTQTGWLFRGGNSIGMHPYVPGYLEGDQSIALSTGGTGKFNALETSASWSDNGQGPCPSGYMVASIQDFASLVSNSAIRTGYVHDDDPYAGYQYSGGSVIFDENHVNSCNPAKGALFIDNDNSGKCIFMTFGKGAMTTSDSRRNEGYMDEIGVGHRGRKSGNYSGWGALFYAEYLSDSQKYGAIYWSSTRGTDDRIEKADFNFDIMTGSPYLIDDPTKPGLPVNDHGNLVRCVRKSSSSETGTRTINLRGSFKYYTSSWNTSNIYEAKISIMGLSSSFTVRNGKATSSSITIPSGWSDSSSLTLYYSSNDITRTCTTTIADLQNANKDKVFRRR